MDRIAVATRAFHNPVEPRYLLYFTRTNRLTSLLYFTEQAAKFTSFLLSKYNSNFNVNDLRSFAML